MHLTRKLGTLAGLAGAVILLATGTATAITPRELPHGPLTQSLVKADGSILTAGLSLQRQAFLLQLRSDGTVDEGFSDGGGKLLSNGQAEVNALLPAADGRSIVVIYDEILKLNADGSADTSFGDAGVAGNDLEPVLGNYGSDAAAVQPDGKIVTTGYSSSLGPYVARFTETGELDGTFGNGGIGELDTSLTPDSQFSSLGIGVDQQGRILVVGETRGTAGVMRLLTDGTLDPSYGPDGDGLAMGATIVGAGINRYSATGPFIGDDGGLRVYARSNEFMYTSRNLAYGFDPDGNYVPIESGVYDTGTTVETGDGQIARAVTGTAFEGRGSIPPVFGIGVGNRSSSQLTGHRFPLSPSFAAIHHLEYVPGENTVVAVGQAGLYQCLPGCTIPSRFAVAKFDADTGQAVSGFGTGGAVLVPENECPYGTGDSSIQTLSPWRQCRVAPPRLDGRIKVIRGKRGPRLEGRVTFAHPFSKPLAGRRLKVKLPAALRPATPRRKVKVYGGGAGYRATFKGHTITVTSGRPVFLWEPYEGEPYNKPVTIRFGLKAGSLKAIPRKQRGKWLRFSVEGTYLPAFFDTRNSGNYGQIDWFADNSSAKTFKTRAARPRGR